jgi:hypothetical protein
MSKTKLKRPIVTLAVTARLLAAAGPASADTSTGGAGRDQNRGHSTSLVDQDLSQPDTRVFPELDANANAVRPINLKSDKNEVAIEGFWLPSNDALGFASPTQ